MHHGLERPCAYVWICHPRIGVLPDVRRNAVQVLEGAFPGDRARASGRDERAVDVEQQDPAGVRDPVRIRPSALRADQLLSRTP
jgi:hypothetical protein